MTEEQKEQVVEYILLGMKLTWISEKLDIPVDELKLYCRELNRIILLN